MMWGVTRQVEAQTGDSSAVKSAKDACRIVVETDLKMDGQPAQILRALGA
jgi:hypothetical protein